MSKDSTIISNAISAANEGLEAQEYDKSTLDLTNINKGASFTNIKELFAEYGYNSINASFDLFDINGTFDKIKDLIQKNKISLVVAWRILCTFYSFPCPSYCSKSMFKAFI